MKRKIWRETSNLFTLQILLQKSWSSSNPHANPFWKKPYVCKQCDCFLSDQPFMEQISSKYLLPSVSSNRYLAKFLSATFNWSSTYSSHPVLFLIKLRCFFCKSAGSWACNQLALKYVEESESAFQIFLSGTNET